MTHVIYGSLWNDELMVMLDPVPEDEGRATYVGGGEIWIAGGPEPLTGIDPEDFEAPDGEDPAAWSIFAVLERGYLQVDFYNLWGVKEAFYAFRRQEDGRLFLTDVSEYEYADPTDRQAEWSSVTEYHFEPDGYSSEVTRTELPDGSQDVKMVERSGGDFSNHYEPVPAFGEWAGVLKRQR